MYTDYTFTRLMNESEESVEIRKVWRHRTRTTTRTSTRARARARARFS